MLGVNDVKKYAYDFNEGNLSLKPLLGGKGAGLAEMTSIGLPVPFGFTLTTEACNEYCANGNMLGEELKTEIFQQLERLEKHTTKEFGSKQNPLLLSVRSGAVVSMPGMMDTILNLGLNDESVKAMAALTNNERFAYDSYRRFIQMYADVVLGIAKYKFENVLNKIKEENSITNDTELTVENLRKIVSEFKKIIIRERKIDFPQDVKEQLLSSIEAVFKSWNNPRAKIYREINSIPDNLGTAVNIQSMVFGNMGEASGTGVAFTRNPSSGEKKLFGEFLINAQGEDVVAGIRTPNEISQLKEIMPKTYDEFIKIAEVLEEHYKEMQDIEFTIENNKLYILQTRTGKRTTQAAINIAVDMVEEGLITKKEAIFKVEPTQLDQLLHPRFDKGELVKHKRITTGLGASPGAATGKVFLNSQDAVKAYKEGEKVILVREETSPEDIEGMSVSEGILTARGGTTSHAAVVGRGMGKCCIVGAGEIKIDEKNKCFRVGNTVVKEGEYISLDGEKGNVYNGKIPITKPELMGKFQIFMNWADSFRKMKVRANADTPKDAKQALDFGAEGIGLCRTEHMFFESNRITTVREMIVARDLEQRMLALRELLPMQREDFISIFKIMKELPVTVRLLDPPLHEFLPQEEKEIEELAKNLNMTYAKLKEVVNLLMEVNPMLGHRGCRLAITYPEIYEMQVRAIIEAAVHVKKYYNINVQPEIMVPLVGETKEFQTIKATIINTANEIFEEENYEIKYLIGTMIEVPRAALVADEIAKEAEFFSFGTNDLTQMTYGFSRDDAGVFIKEYINKKILENDPFQSIDQKGVGRLMEIAVELGKKERPDIKIGICGEHGGEPKSIEFCKSLGLDYVSCSPYRVIVARLASAQSDAR
ncbi:MAG: pyruvate, phosphate dikinase [Clostridiales bacterium]|nr:pyruvate, phosphate dikinase [Clostridiales bacterium]